MMARKLFHIKTDCLRIDNLKKKINLGGNFWGTYIIDARFMHLFEISAKLCFF